MSKDVDSKNPPVADIRHRIENTYIDQRRVFISGSVGNTTTYNTLTALEHIAASGPGAITLTINSPGGSVYDGLALFDGILDLRHRGHVINTVAQGWAASMGIILLQAGTERSMGRHTRLLIHSISMNSMGAVTVHDAEEQAQELRRLNDLLVDIIVDRSGLDRELLETKTKKKDWWIGAEEALKLKLVDRLG